MYTRCETLFCIPASIAALENLLDIQLGPTGAPRRVTNSGPDGSCFLPSLNSLHLR